ncbi:MAG: lysophospholipid acyltransferase family protein [Pleurocapsa sp.]
MSETKFLPPKRNALFTRLVQSIFYLVMYFAYQIKLEVSDRDIGILKEIDDKRVVYLPNHSNLDDGLVMFLFSARLGQLFHYIVAYEAFNGFIGRLMQLVGAYSIRRGVGDRSSIIQTLKILQQPQCKLVIFPEGGCSYQNDTVMPFRTGGIELAFKAISKLKNQTNTSSDLYFVPVSIKYFYHGKTNLQIDKALRELEAALSLQSTDKNFYQRLRQVSEKVLTDLETEYQIESKVKSDWNQRIAKLKQHLLNYCEDKLNIDSATQLPNRERVYKIQSILADLSQSEPESAINLRHIKLTTVRLLNFDAIYDGYVADEPTSERFFATLDRLEREVFKIDRPKSRGLRKARIKVGMPINAEQYWQNSKCDAQKTIKDLTEAIQQKVQANLS